MSEKTRIVQLPTRVTRERADNETTRIAALHAERRRADPAILFAKHEAKLHEALEQLGPGTAVFALSESHGLAGQLWLEASADEVRAGSVGRHGAADLYLPFDQELSLRHLAVVVRLHGGAPVTRVMDLRTGDGFYDERAERHSAVESDGVMVLAAASWWLFVFPTGGPAPWTKGAKDAFASLPERVFEAPLAEAQAQGAKGPKAKVHSQRPAASRERSYVTPYRAPVDTSTEAPVSPGEHTAGHLVIDRDEGEVRIPVGPSALDRGVMLGRYSRCDDAKIFSDDRISRVHALVMRIEGGVWIFDLGSTNGTYGSANEEFRARQLHSGESFQLAVALTLRWEEPN